MIAEECGIPKTIVHRILTKDLQMRKVCAKMVPKVLTSEMKEERLFKCQELHERFETDPEFSERVITGDETWIFEYDLESKRQSREWHTTDPKKSKDEEIANQANARCVF
ncbi:unnamed protein product [Ixodes persulcatus]